MLRHVSQHDLPLSVQEMQKLNNRKMAFHSPGPRQKRELKVDVFPSRRIPRSINTTTRHSKINSRKESILNYQDNNNYDNSNNNNDCNNNNGNNISFNGEMSRESINSSVDSETNVNNENKEDEMNNNREEMKSEHKDSSIESEPLGSSESEEDDINNSRDKQLQCSLPENMEKNNVCKSTQTNLAVTPNSKTVKYNQTLDRHTKSFQIQMSEAGGINRSSIITHGKKLKHKSSSKMNFKKCGRISTNESKVHLLSILGTKCAKSRIIHYKPHKKYLKEENKHSMGLTYLLKDVCLPLIPYLPLISVSFLIASCAASNIYLLIEPNFMYLAKKCKFLSPKSDSQINEIIPTFFTKIIKYIYVYIRSI